MRPSVFLIVPALLPAPIATARAPGATRSTGRRDGAETATFRLATVKQVLEWFARETGVRYRAEGPPGLPVLVPMERPDV